MPVTHDDAANTLDSVTGINGVQHGGTGADLSATGPGILKQATLGAAVTVGDIALSDLPSASANSVIGRAAGSSGDVAAIAAANNGDLLRLRNGTLTWARDNVFNVLDCGATGDGATDDATAIGTAVTEFVAAADAGSNPLLYFPACAGYAAASAISILLTTANECSVLMDAPLIYTGSSQTGAFLTIGMTGSAKNIAKGTFRLWVYRSTISDWSDDSHAGIRLLNFNGADIRIVESAKFTTGVKCEGSGDGFAYNNVNLGTIFNNKYGVELTCSTASAVDGWCNGNLFLGGRFGNHAGQNDGTARYGIRFKSRLTSPAVTSPNGNLFIKPIVELGAGGQNANAHPFLFEHGTDNQIVAAHIEGAAEHVQFDSGVYNNKIEVIYSAQVTATKVDNSANALNVVVTSNRGTDAVDLMNKLVWSAPDLAGRASPYSSTTVMIPGVGVLQSTGGVQVNGTKGANNLDIAYDGTNPSYVSVGQSAIIGVKVDTTDVKDFLFRVAGDGAYAGRIVVQAYDAAGAVITSATDASAVIAQNNSGFAYDATYNGVWWTTSGWLQQVFRVSSNVKSIFVGTMGVVGTNVRAKGLYLYTNALHPNVNAAGVSPGYFPPFYEMVATQSPETSAWGTWKVGQRVLNATPSVSKPAGWICTVAGSPGTWVPFGMPVSVGSAIASAATIAPTSSVHHVTGTTAVVTITVPTGFPNGGQIVLIPDGLWTWTTAGNIALAGSAVVGKAVIFTWDASASKWYPSVVS